MKTFSKSKFIETEGTKEYKKLEVLKMILGNDINWIDECDGKPTSYLRQRGYSYKDAWLVSDGAESDEFETKFNKAMELTLKELKRLQDEVGLKNIEKVMFTEHSNHCFELLRYNLFKERN